MYIPGRSRTCSTPSRTWMSADPYCPGLVAAARLVAVLATSPPSRNAGAPDSRRRVSGADGTAVIRPLILPIGGDAERVSTPHPRLPAWPRTPCATSLSAGRHAQPPAPWRRSRGRSPSRLVRGSDRQGTGPARPRVRWSRRPPGRRVRGSPGRTPRPTGGPPPTPNRTRADRSACPARTSARVAGRRRRRRSWLPSGSARPCGARTPWSAASRSGPSGRDGPGRHVQDERRRFGHVGVVGNADEDLSAAREPLSDQPLPARVEGREGVVQEQDRAFPDLVRDRAPEPEPQAQRRRPGLSVAREAPGAEVPDRQRQVVAMGADQGGPPDHLVAAAFGQPALERLLERLPGHVRSVLAAEAVPGEVAVLLLRRGGEPRRGLGAETDQRAHVLDQLGIPGLQPRRCPASLPLLEQPIALSQRAFVGRHRGLLERPH